MKYILFIFTLLFWNQGFTQSKLNYEWIQGVLFKSSIVKFENNVFKYNRDFDTSLNNAYWFLQGSNICDSSGNLYLLSNGFNVIDSNTNFVDGLDSIGGREFMKVMDGFSGYSQYSIFLPMGNGIYYFVNNSVSDSFFAYYLNTPGLDFNFDELMYCKIDMAGNGGLGQVLKREIKIIENDTLSDVQMMACRHANGKDWWLFKQGSIENRVYKFLFANDSVYNCGTQTFAEPIFSKWDHGGQSMFSQDGKKYATTCRGTGEIFVADFDRCTGILSNPKVYAIDTLSAHNPLDTTQKDFFSEGLAFSPNGRFIYVYMYYNIQQLDLWDTDTTTQWSVVAGLDTTWDAFQSYSGMYLGPDAKLYIGNWASLYCKQMSYFNSPDEKGLASDFCPRCLRFPNFGVTRPPTMPNYDLGAELPCWPLSSTHYSEDNTQLEIYPNPTTNMITIKGEFLNQRENEIVVYNLLGQNIFQTKFKTSGSQFQIDLSEFENGVYLLKVNEFVRKIVKE